MSIESPDDLAGLKAIGSIVGLTLRAMQQELRPGMSSGELDQVAARELQRHGAEPSPRLVYGFPGACCISVNSQVIHGVPNATTIIRPGDLVKLDLTAQKDGYIADAAVSVPLAPAGATAQRLAACARAAFDRAMAVAKAGARVGDVGRAVQKEVTACGFEVLRQWCGHGVGRRIHEDPQMPNFDDRANRAVLREGMVVAVEPVITAGVDKSYVAADGWTVVTADGALSAHYEHTILITAGAPLLLTAA